MSWRRSSFSAGVSSSGTAGAASLVAVASGGLVDAHRLAFIAFILRGKELGGAALQFDFFHGDSIYPAENSSLAKTSTSKAKVIAWAPHDRLLWPGLSGSARGLDDLRGKRFGSVVKKDRVAQLNIVLP